MVREVTLHKVKYSLEKYKKEEGNCGLYEANGFDTETPCKRLPERKKT
jgi:hypothetical protein